MIRPALLLACCAFCACATTGTSRAPGSSAPVEWQGILALSDGTPVVGADLTIRCGGLEQATRTDEAGRFALRNLPDGDCTLACPAARLSRQLRSSRDRREQLNLRLPPMHRLSLDWSDGSSSGALILDETVAHRLRVGPRSFALERSTLVVETAGKVLRRPAGDLQGHRLRLANLTVRVTRVEKRPWLPLALRRSLAPADAFLHAPLFSPDGQLVRPALGARTLVVAGSCEQLRLELLDELEALVVSHKNVGLRGLAVLTEPCPSGEHSSGQVLLGSPEVFWAIGARAGEIAVLDPAGRSLRLLTSLDDARTYLDRSWPAFAASSKVSVELSASVREAEADRLLVQAREKEKSGRHAEAHQLLDEVLKLAPESAEARKERALLKAKLGDLGGALREVTWWRTSFGAEAADDLQEEVERTARVSTLR